MTNKVIATDRSTSDTAEQYLPGRDKIVDSHWLNELRAADADPSPLKSGIKVVSEASGTHANGGGRSGKPKGDVW